MGPFLARAAIVLGTVVLMEGLAWAAHKYLMHGWGWGWHRSHHERHDGLLEKNDLYALVFGALAFGLILLGGAVPGLYWVGIGFSLYGLLYFILHDGLAHGRWPFRVTPRNPYLRRLVQAHRLHHATAGRDGAVSFGFLYAPPVRRLADELRQRRGDGR